ncbi:MAG: sensor histidine kinase [Clostridia bacterium]|nr:sensor histidine kinase [Clostridia bacterium]
MSFVFRYLRDHLHLLMAGTAFICFFAISFALYHLPLAAVAYPTGLCLLLGCLLAVSPVRKAYQKHEALTKICLHRWNTVNNELLLYDTMVDEDYRYIIEHLSHEIQSVEAQMDSSRKAMIDYYSTWVHQIKTPIASMRLHLKAVDTALARKLLSDLLHIEQYVDMVLTYLRMGSSTTDYVFREISLDDILSENIRKYRGDFIMKNLRLQYEPSGMSIISDEKWLSFVIGQILSNSLKYTKQGTVTILTEAPRTLCIKDTGIGIAAEDLPRIFEQGFTGYNGHVEKRASGIGLYLCKQICDRLGHSIAVTSMPEIGTEVRIDFSQIYTVRD